MTCYRTDFGNGAVGFICVRGSRVVARPCPFCRHLTATLLCDGRVPGARPPRTRRCDSPICGGCAKEIGEDLHHCPDCVKRAAEEAAKRSAAPVQGELFK